MPLHTRSELKKIQQYNAKFLTFSQWHYYHLRKERRQKWKMTRGNWIIASSVASVLLVATLTTHGSVDAFLAPLHLQPARSIRAGAGVSPLILQQAADAWSNSAASSPSGGGGIEQIEFKIYPDGRVEETVRGIKGGNCHKVTEHINKALGKVVDTRPTEEMFEQEVEVENTLYNRESSSWEDSSSW